jgi:hypothetical protein
MNKNEEDEIFKTIVPVWPSEPSTLPVGIIKKRIMSSKVDYQ